MPITLNRVPSAFVPFNATALASLLTCTYASRQDLLRQWVKGFGTGEMSLKPANPPVRPLWSVGTIANELIIFAFTGVPIGQQMAEYTSGALLADDFPGGGKVNRGFYNAYKKLRGQCFEELAQRPPYKILVCGHSQGGTIAVQFGVDLAEQLGGRFLGVVTFGAPKLGDAAFNARVTGAHLRIENTSDVITQLPPSGGLFEQLGIFAQPIPTQWTVSGIPVVFDEKGRLGGTNLPWGEPQIIQNLVVDSYLLGNQALPDEHHITRYVRLCANYTDRRTLSGSYSWVVKSYKEAAKALRVSPYVPNYDGGRS